MQYDFHDMASSLSTFHHGILILTVERALANLQEINLEIFLAGSLSNLVISILN